jgi:acetyl-CoA carboxylase biotin carboxyl carrier protein
MDLEAIFKLMDRAEKSSFTKVEFQSGDLRLSLERGVYTPAASAAYAAPTAEAVRELEEKDAVRSPISGVFYLRKEPGAEPFVSVGASVNKGDTLCIIEAMKTMNEIRSPKSGVISGIIPEDGAMVAAGESLFLLSEGN